MKLPIQKVPKPWGYELIFAHTDHYVGKLLHLDPDRALSLQYHETKDETLYMLAGEVELVVDENGSLVRRSFNIGEAYHISPGVRHRLIAGSSGCDIVEVSTPHLDDVVRLEDDYGRA